MRKTPKTVQVNKYKRKDGTTVPSHKRSKPDGIKKTTIHIKGSVLYIMIVFRHEQNTKTRKVINDSL